MNKPDSVQAGRAFALGAGMLAFSVKHNIADVQRTLSKAAKQQLPFAIAKGLTQTAKATQDKLTSALPRQLDKPTPFTMRAFGVTAATKQRQLATVFIKPDQWKYLKYQVEGGVRRPAKRAVIVPESMRLNQYGNMPKGAVRKLLAKAGVFSGTVDGVAGIWQRKGGRAVLLVKYADKVVYKRRFPFADIGERSVAAVFGPIFNQALADALATMR
ncbi:hypothetical protein HI806_09205 [Ralstonia solanacearum]|nr:hypothetical protein HI806_09205 [Ralstonia solanacearum]QKL76654.1 hypothetical protein HI805_09215 [Ralstonia solanacearum]QKL81858.1 hypothetical protein HI804_09215 [Ralstonia solanacearum]QKL87069.1 hypothetical protein HI803_09220 [Ralstonia solanacearum]QKM02435.1 hypothetical protein HI800_09215 [Ralstonia solanacearum]